MKPKFSKEQIMTRIVLLLVLALLGALIAQRGTAQESVVIDKALIKRGQVAANGDEQVLALHITGKSINEPFAWTFTITDSHGNVTYHAARNDAWLDTFFKDTAYVGHCSGYSACKQRYYFHDLPESIFRVLEPSQESWGQDAFDQENLRDVAGRFLRAKGLPPDRVERALAEMAQILAKPGFHVLDVPQSAVQSDPPMIWVPSVESFVPFHED
jgi:hypothetical protein